MTRKNMNRKNITRKTKPLVVDPPVQNAIFPIVGIGASAGGLAAFETFFSGMPKDVDPGMAFVLVQHLAPDHKSLLADLIRRYTRMPVFEVEDGMPVHINSIYIIPPSYDMALMHGSLQLLAPALPRGQRLPIDFFFRSLAQDQRDHAIGIVLSGSGSDGTLGVRAIKGEDGMVMVQSPEDCEFDAMPRSAIATCLVDYQLPAAQMAAQLIRYAAQVQRRPYLSPVAEDMNEAALKKIFLLLRTQTGHDFSNYKPSTITRRIERRMAVNQVESIEGYVKYLQQTPTEVQLLFGDLLIGVTHFFRDAEAFQVFESQAIPKLFADKPVGSLIRVWSIGCSTGEEAYSIAILLQEHLQKLKQSYAIQVFATDLDGRAISTARGGLYPASIAVDLTPERLARFFTAEADGSGYRIHKTIRDMLVFSEQNVIKDPPFSKLDLISCRNLMIYLNADLQKKLMPLFHYALNAQGILFLGTSEGVGEFSELFSVLDRKAKLYQRKAHYLGLQRLTLGSIPSMVASRDVASRDSRDKEARNQSDIGVEARVVSKKIVKSSLREWVEQALLQHLAPVGVLVNAAGDIFYVHGRSGLFLEPMSGDVAVNNILKMAREGLRPALYGALQKATLTQQSLALSVKTNGHFTPVNLHIRPLTADATQQQPLYLVVLEQATPKAESAIVLTDSALPNSAPDDANADAQIAALRQELRAKDDYLQSAQEELESSNEELKSANEEMQSVNEELQSTNEELETSKEELQSVNEELATVNTELQTKLADLTQANNDMNNLLAGTGVATVFVDLQLRILRFTPIATQIINLITSDIGRPVSHLVCNLKAYDSLVTDVQAVLQSLIPKELEVQTHTGTWYTMRIQPYRTLDNVIEGAVITFADITEAVRTREALHDANQLLRLAVVVRDAFDAITVQDLEGHMIAWNPGAVRLYGWSEAEALLLGAHQRIPLELRKDELAKLHQLSRAQVLQPYQTQRLTKEGKTLQVWMIATALLNHAGQMYAIATTERAFE
jgi:two-component system CheB/CheR fusion protein